MFLMLMFAGLSLSACKKDDYVISFYWWGTSDRNIATYQVINLFNEKYPEYKVKGSSAPWGGYLSTLQNRLKRA